MKSAAFYDAGVVGAGPAGLAAALALARQGLRIVVIGLTASRPDTRTAALFTGSVRLLENLGTWDDCRPASEPMRGIRIVDDIGTLWRAPEVLFTAAEAGLDCFGYNVPNAALVEALRHRALSDPNVTLIEGAVESIEIRADGAELRLADGRTFAVTLVVGADGRNSLCRRAAGIEVRTWAYEQSALACTFSHQRPHAGISTEFHRRGGPLAVVPSPGLASSLVWVDRPAEAERLQALDDADFRAELEDRLQGLLGSVGDIGPRGVFPLSGLAANVSGQKRVALVGEAAHVIPPIGAQGLNLGLRDAAILADCVADGGDDAGAPAVLERYATARHTDVTSRIWAIDLLNRSLLSEYLPVKALRGLGLHVLKSVGPVRRLAMREGLAPSFVTPRLMQPAEYPGEANRSGGTALS
jgi:2-octaprenyl-6-methoxyphenol hydroxylase